MLLTPGTWLCRPELLLGEDIMINVKKLRVLQRKGDEMERQKVVEKTRKYLASVGDRIKAVATQERTRRLIWQVSLVSRARGSAAPSSSGR